MSVSAATLRLLIDAGLEGDVLVAVVASIDADMRGETHVSVLGHGKECSRQRMNARRQECSSREWRRLRQHVFERDGWRCVYCGGTKTLEADHVVPLIRGGKSVLGNLVAACKVCNSSKGSRRVEDWLPWQ